MKGSGLSTLLSGVREDDHISQQPCNDNADRIKQDTSVAEMDNCNGDDDIIQKGHINSAYNEPTNVNHGGNNCHASGKEKDDKNDSMNSLAAAEDSDQVMRTQDKCSDDDSEPDEDQTALDYRQQVTGDALPTVVQIGNLENQMYQCAPSKSNIPKFILLDDDFEVLAFPDLFPDGTGAYHSPNGPEHLGIQKYFQQCLLNVDIHIAQNMEYLFCAQYIADIKQIQSDANLAIHLSCGRTFHGERITAGMLCNLNAIKQLVRTEQAYTFLKNVCGSSAYWQNELYDVLAMLHSLGIPTWFLTLSAAGLHWPKIIQAIAVQIGQHLSHKDIFKISIAERSRYLQQNPVTCVCMFQHHVDSFFMHYLLSKTRLLSVIIDYVIKIEFQMRGAPHAPLLTMG